MNDKFRSLVAIVICSLLAACSDNTSKLPSYKITLDKFKGDIKRTVEVELDSRTDAETLQALAEHIHSLSNKEVQRTFIGYRIKGAHQNESYWATTHYNPNLEVVMLGSSLSEYEKIKNSDLTKQNSIGTWLASWGYDYKITAYKKDDQIYIRNTYADGSTDEIFELLKTDKGIKLQNESTKGHGEYFIINKNGDLEFWSENGNYYTAPKY